MTVRKTHMINGFTKNTIAKDVRSNKRHTTFYRSVAALVALILFVVPALFFVTPAAVFAEEDTNPQLLDLPRADSDADAATEALKKQIEDLKKIIRLNVEEADGIPVLLYHHVMNEKDMKPEHHDNHNIISTELFETHMKYLSDNRYYTASIEELEQFIAGKTILPKRTVVITFDDGYRSNTRYCYSILKKYGFKASMFVITSLIGAKEGVIEHASWADMNKSSDVFSYYSHSHDLHKLDREGKSLMITSSQSVIRKDMLLARAFVNCSYLAYPYGQRNQTVMALLRRTGYRMAFTTDTGYVKKRSNVYELPRFTITPLISVEKFGDIVKGAAVVTTTAS